MARSPPNSFEGLHATLPVTLATLHAVRRFHVGHRIIIVHMTTIVNDPGYPAYSIFSMRLMPAIPLR